MSYKGRMILCAVAAAACASGGQGNRADEAPGDQVTMVVINEYANALTVYVRWRGRRRMRLGDVQRNRTGTFTTRLRGDRVVLWFEALSTVPAGTTTGATAFGGRTGRDADSPNVVASSAAFAGGIPVDPGDIIEWTLAANRSLTWRRLPGS